MPATAEQVARLRRMVDENDPETYTEEVLAQYIERSPLMDHAGYEPSHPDWAPVYDLHAAAAAIWEEKAAALAQDHDFSADGGQFSRAQAFQHAFRMAQHHRSRRNPRSRKVRVAPVVPAEPVWVGNLPERDE